MMTLNETPTERGYCPVSRMTGADLEAIRARLSEVGLVARAHLDRGRSSMPITIEDATLLPILLAEVDRLRELLADATRRMVAEEWNAPGNGQRIIVGIDPPDGAHEWGEDDFRAWAASQIMTVEHPGGHLTTRASAP